MRQLVEMLVVKQALGFISGAMGITAGAKGMALDNGKVTPYASGGVVSSPTFFPMAKGTGLMGEAGPEMIAPLFRDSKGDMGVKSTAPVVNVSVENYGNDNVDVQQDAEGNINIVIAKVVDSINRSGVVGQAIQSRYGIGNQ